MHNGAHILEAGPLHIASTGQTSAALIWTRPEDLFVDILIIMTMAAKSLAHLKHLRLPETLFNAQLIDQIHKIWFKDLPPGASVPTQQNQGDWVGKDRTLEEKVAFDTHLRNEFGNALEALGPSKYPLPPAGTCAEEREYAGVISTPIRRLDVLSTHDKVQKAKAGLGIILLLDQISRNIFRTQEGQGVVYGHYDRISRALAHSMFLPELTAKHGADDSEDLADLGGLASIDPQLRQSAPRHNFFLLPLMHSEDLQDHDVAWQQMQQTRKVVEDRGDEEGVAYADLGMGFEVKHRNILEQFGRYPYRNGCLGRDMRAEEQKYLDEGGERFTAAA